MNKNVTYQPQRFNLSGLHGISDQTLEAHFKLYEGYVEQTNTLNEKIAAFLSDGHVEQDEMPAYSELTPVWALSITGWCCTSTTLAT